MNTIASAGGDGQANDVCDRRRERERFYLQRLKANGA
jgi:hypothetical protein